MSDGSKENGAGFIEGNSALEKSESSSRDLVESISDIAADMMIENADIVLKMKRENMTRGAKPVGTRTRVRDKLIYC